MYVHTAIAAGRLLLHGNQLIFALFNWSHNHSICLIPTLLAFTIQRKRDSQVQRRRRDTLQRKCPHVLSRRATVGYGWHHPRIFSHGCMDASGWHPRQALGWARRRSGGCDQRQGARVGIARAGGGPENLAALLTIGPRLPRVCLRVLVIAMIHHAHPERLCSHKPHSHNAFVLTPPSCADETHPIASRPPLRV